METNITLVATFLRRLLWLLVGLIDIIILWDWFFNYGKLTVYVLLWAVGEK